MFITSSSRFAHIENSVHHQYCWNGFYNRQRADKPCNFVLLSKNKGTQ